MLDSSSHCELADDVDESDEESELSSVSVFMIVRSTIIGDAKVTFLISGSGTKQSVTIKSSLAQLELFPVDGLTSVLGHSANVM